MFQLGYKLVKKGTLYFSHFSQFLARNGSFFLASREKSKTREMCRSSFQLTTQVESSRFCPTRLQVKSSRFFPTRLEFKIHTYVCQNTDRFFRQIKGFTKGSNNTRVNFTKNQPNPVFYLVFFYLQCLTSSPANFTKEEFIY